MIPISRGDCHNDRMKHTLFALTLPAVLIAAPAFADFAVVERVGVDESSNGWRFEVTLSHPDTGWEHYADAWRVLDMQGKELAIRILVHPHVGEQPFTRSLSGVDLPDGTTQVQIQARCLVDGWSPEMTTVSLN